MLPAHLRAPAPAAVQTALLRGVKATLEEQAHRVNADTVQLGALKAQVGGAGAHAAQGAPVGACAACSLVRLLGIWVCTWGPAQALICSGPAWRGGGPFKVWTHASARLQVWEESECLHMLCAYAMWLC